MKKLNKNILIVAPHADDEILGCGGSIIKWKNDNNKVYVLIMTNANKGEPLSFSKKYIKKIREEAKKANNFLNVDGLFFENLPAPNLDVFPSTKISKIINKYISDLEVNEILLPFNGDLHHDHNKITSAGIVSSRPFSKIRKIMFYETLSETEWGYTENFVPNYFVSLDKKTLDKKIKSFEFYTSQNKSNDHPRSTDGIIALAKFRGLNICKSYAESFRILRLID